MDAAQIESQIRDIIAKVTGIDANTISLDASFVDELEIDSLSLLEIGVDVDYAFKLGLPDERLQQLRTLRDSVDLVMERLAEGSVGDSGSSPRMRSGAA